MLNPMFLNGVLNKAIQYSSCTDAKDTTSNLSFVLKHMPNILQPNGKMLTFMTLNDRLNIMVILMKLLAEGYTEKYFFHYDL